MSVRAGRIQHANGTATTTPAKVSVKRGVAQWIRIGNLDATNNLEVSFDGGTNYYTIEPGDPPFEADALFHFFYVRSSAATVDYSATIVGG